MPLDPSIPLSVRPIEIPSPIQTIGSLMQMRGAMAQLAHNQALAEQERQRSLEIQAQTTQRNRDLSDQNTVQELSKDPANAKAFGAGDFTSLNGKVQPGTLNKLTEAHAATREKLATAHQHELDNMGKEHGIIESAINGLKSLGDDAAIATEAPQVFARLQAQGVIPPNTPMPQITGAKDLDRYAAQNAWLQGAIDAALKTKKEQQGIDVQAAEEARKAALAPGALAAQALTNTKLEQETTGTQPISPYQQGQLDKEKNTAIPAEQQFVNEYRAKKPGASIAEAQRAFKLNEHIVSPEAGMAALDREAARFAKPHEKSLSDANAQLEKIADARAMINGNAEAQALGVPKVLTALVSGQGSGVRITQPELNAIAQARGVKGSIEGFISSISGEGKLTGTQKQQLTQILDDVQQRLTHKREIANGALDKINGARSRDEIVSVDKNTRQQLADLETTPAKVGKFNVTDPTGKNHAFDTQAQADAFKKLAGIK